MLTERDIEVEGSTVYRWVVKFSPEVSKRNFSHRDRRGQTWHVDEIYICVGGKWRYLWRARKAMDNARL